MPQEAALLLTLPTPRGADFEAAPYLAEAQREAVRPWLTVSAPAKSAWPLSSGLLRRMFLGQLPGCLI